MGAICASLVNSIFETWIFNFGNASTVPFWLFLSIVSHQAGQAQLRVRYASIRMWGVYPRNHGSSEIVNRMKYGKAGTSDSRIG